MATLYVLDVPEFRPLVDAASAEPSLHVGRQGHYCSVSRPGRLVIERGPTGLTLAVWFGALTGGYAGRIERFDEQALVIRDA